MATRYYSNVAPPTTLSAGINAITTTITVASAAGLPPFQPFTLALDPNTPTMELVEVTAAAGTTLTVTRAIDGTSASTHGAGATVLHVSSARDFAEANAHINASTNVHGLAGGAAVVGTTTTQTLTNKTLDGPTINDGTITNTQITTNDPTVTGNLTTNGTAHVTGNTQLDGNLAVGTAPAFLSQTELNGSLLVQNAAIMQTQSALGTILTVSKGVGQTGNLQDWSFGTPLASINGFGEFSCQSSTATGASVFSIGAGWTLSSAQATKTAGVITINILVTRSGANIVATAGGDLADTVVGTVAAAWRPNSTIFSTTDFAVPAQNSIGCGIANMPPSTGVLSLRNWSSNGTISTGNNIGFTMTYAGS